MKLDWQHVVILALGAAFVVALVLLSRGTASLAAIIPTAVGAYLATLFGVLKSSPMEPKLEAPPPLKGGGA